MDQYTICNMPYAICHMPEGLCEVEFGGWIRFGAPNSLVASILELMDIVIFFVTSQR